MQGVWLLFVIAFHANRSQGVSVQVFMMLLGNVVGLISMIAMLEIYRSCGDN